jgi:polyhydroxyalkanoate synthesis regulator phasin
MAITGTEGYFMKKNDFTQLVDEVVKLKLEISDEYIKEVVDAIGQVGSPESLIGKKYEEWTPQDLQLLINVYGQDDESPLGKLIAKKTIERVEDMEKQLRYLEAEV